MIPSMTSRLHLFAGRPGPALAALARRPLGTTTSPANNADPTRVFSHPVTSASSTSAKPEYAITYLPGSTLPTAAAAVIGWSTTKATTSSDLSPRGFRANPAFVDLLHATLGEHAHTDPELVALAEHQKIGWLHLADARNPPPWGRIPDPDDILGSVLIGDSHKIVPGSYQRMPTHRLVSGQGLFVLSPFLHSKLVERLLRL